VSLVIIAVENLRIGGYQRLALDQAYYLSDISQRCLLLLLNPEIPGLKSFETAEEDLIRSKNLVTCRLSGKRIKDFFAIRKILRSENSNVLVISHSMRSTVLFAIARAGLKNKIVINTTIHQLPSLSRFFQRLKRFFYSQFGDNIYAYSDAVQKDWLSRYSNLGKSISILRNGIYKERLDICEVPFDGDPADWSADKKLDFSQGFAFKEYRLYFDPYIYEHSYIDAMQGTRPVTEENDVFTLFEFI
jgi:hypothetical protein